MGLLSSRRPPSGVNRPHRKPMEDFFASSPRGLEPLLADELASLGAQRIRQVPGGAAFSGEWRGCYWAKPRSRPPSAALLRLAAFENAKEEGSHQAARKGGGVRL